MDPGPRLRHGVAALRRGGLADPLYNAVAFGILSVAIVGVLYPLYFVVIASISDPTLVATGGVWFWPRGLTLDGYQRIFSDPVVWRGLANSVQYTATATLISTSLVLSAGYALSRRDLPGRNVLMVVFVATLFFDGGIVPRYLVVRELGMLNTMWAIVLPGAVAVWNLVIARAYFTTNIPTEVHEAARVDGASDLQFFLRIVLPMSKPLIAVLVMIHLVWNWNAFFDALIYLTDTSKYPLQLVLRNILIQSDVSASSAMVGDLSSYAEKQRVAELIKYAMIVFSSAPLLLLFPFAQKYFTKGMTLGAVKG